MNGILKAIREKNNMTQGQIAKEAQISLAQYQNIEYGTSRPRVDTAIRIADALGTTVEEIFKGEENR